MNKGCKLFPGMGAACSCLLFTRAAQFQILRKLSQEPVHAAMPSSVTPRQLTRLSWPARTPTGRTGKNKGPFVTVRRFCTTAGASENNRTQRLRASKGVFTVVHVGLCHVQLLGSYLIPGNGKQSQFKILISVSFVLAF